MPNRWTILVLLILLLASQACTSEVTQPPVVQTEPPTAAPTLPPTPEPPTPVPTAAGRMVTFENVVFFVPNGLSESEQGQIVAAAAGGAPWDVPVQHIQFGFTGYPRVGAFHQPAIYIYPTQGFNMAASAIASLTNLLAQRPADADSMPFLPPFNAAQQFHAQVKYLDFGSGSGVRYLTQYAQYVAPINNHDMFYTFQGLTSDGKYYVAAVLPVAHDSLPASVDQVDMDKFNLLDWDVYLSGIRTGLDAAPDDSFTPSLADLDALVQSITVK